MQCPDSGALIVTFSERSQHARARHPLVYMQSAGWVHRLTDLLNDWYCVVRSLLSGAPYVAGKSGEGIKRSMLSLDLVVVRLRL